jgi:hypothetical protein
MTRKQRESVYAYPLQWPEGWPRAKRREYSPFKMDANKSRRKLLNEIAMMGGKLPVISTNARIRADGEPRADERPVDPGVAVYFERKGKRMVFACDKFWLVRENLHAIALTIEALRGIERWGASEMMERAFSGFKQLAAENEGPSWWGVLQVRAGATVEEIETAYRELAKVAHPDAPTGSHDAMTALNAAREQGLSVARQRGGA